MQTKRASDPCVLLSIQVLAGLAGAIIVGCENSDDSSAVKNFDSRSQSIRTTKNSTRLSHLLENVKVEAESGRLSGTHVASTIIGYSGSGYATGFDAPKINSNFIEDSVELTVIVQNTGAFELFVGYRSPALKKTQVIVNNDAPFPVMLHPSSGFWEVYARKIMLHKGANKLLFLQGWGFYDLDYVRVETSPSAHIYDRVAEELVTPHASPEARALYRYLRSIYGKTTLSGQYNPLDPMVPKSPTALEKLQSITGKTPAVGGFDFIFYSPESRWKPDHGVPQALEWATRWRGIVTFSWHWLVRAKNGGNPTFWMRDADFDIRKAIIQGEPEYSQAIYDMDVIAQELKRLQQARIPVLFRPFHEADGTHFWWGSQNGDAVTKLYQMMFERYTTLHGLDNIIWIWNSESEFLYPGDEFVDIVSTDVYNTARSLDPACHRFEKLYRLVQGKKLIALAENGPPPDPTRIQKLDCPWLFFNTWTGDFVKDEVHTTNAQWKNVYLHPWITNLDGVPEIF